MAANLKVTLTVVESESIHMAEPYVWNIIMNNRHLCILNLCKLSLDLFQLWKKAMAVCHRKKLTEFSGFVDAEKSQNQDFIFTSTINLRLFEQT